ARAVDRAAECELERVDREVDPDQHHRHEVHAPHADARRRGRHSPDALRLARVLRAAQPDGRRRHALVADRPPAFRARKTGFPVGAPPRELAAGPRARTLILSTTNGTAAILTAAARCETVLIGSLLNLRAVAAAARAVGDDVAIFCAGFKGAFASTTPIARE